MNKKVKNIIINDDCNNIISTMVKMGIVVDLILTDPPYNVSRKHQLGFSNMGRNGMNFGEWDYDFNQLKWLNNVFKIVKKGGSIIIFNDWKNLGDIARKMEKEGFIIKDILRWIKNNPMPRNVNRRYVTDYEFAIWATKPGDKWTFNKSSEKKYERAQFDHPVVSSKNRIHPTQKPIKLMEEIIKIHSNKGEIIFDPFSGSGSTGLAAINQSRKFILVERDKKIYEESKQQFDKITTSL